jgi:hypothetical protein
MSLKRDGSAYQRPSLWSRLKVAVAVLRGREWWGDDYPTPWAYEQVCKALRRERYGA